MCTAPAFHLTGRGGPCTCPRLLWFDRGLPEEACGHSCTATAFHLTGRGGPCTRPRLLWFECGLQEEAYGHSCTAPAFHLMGRGGPCTCPRLLWFECGLQEEAYGHSCTAPAFHLTGRGGPCTRPRLLWFQPMPMAWMRERYVCTRACLPNLERGALRCPHLLPLVDLSWPLVDLTHVVPSLRLCMVSPTAYGWFFNSVSLVPFRVHLKGRLAFSGRGVATP